jgi:taurine dioxygenase
MKPTLQQGPGVLVTEIDLGDEVSLPDIEHLRELYRNRYLLVFRDQSLSPERQVEVTGWFGHVRASGDTTVGYVSNVRPDGIVPEGPLPFHSDMSFTEHPLRGISLHALEVPDSGGSTRFADAVVAVTKLPATVRDALCDRSVLNIAGYGANFAARRKEAACDPLEPRAEHPAIDLHTETGRPVLRINGLSTSHIVGLTEADSDRLLDEVLGCLYREDNVYEHHWQVGDFLVFDNIAIHHARADFDSSAPRTLQRVVLADDDRFEPGPQLLALYHQAAFGPS